MLASAGVIHGPHIPFLEDEEREHAYAQTLRNRCCNGSSGNHGPDRLWRRIFHFTINQQQ
jgi:hypothetical protein